MKTILYVTVIVLSLMTVSCTQVPNVHVGEVQGYDNDLLSNGDKIQIGSFDIVDLEMTDESLIDNILRVECVDSIILVQTIDKLFAFNRRGSYICRYGDFGKGPYEYLRLSSFVVDRSNKTLRIIDGASNRILTFSLDGRPLSEKRYDRDKFYATETWSGIQLSNDKILFTKQIFNDKHSLYTIFDTENNSDKEVCEFPVKTNNTEERTGASTVSFCNDTVKLLIPFDNTIYFLDDSRLCPIMKISTEQKMVKSNQVESINDFSIMTYAGFMNNKYFTGFTSIYETDKYVFLQVLFNLQYFLIDKGSAMGRLYDYSLSEEQQTLPLIHIIGVDSDRLIGLGEPIRLLGMKENISKTTDDLNLIKLRNYLEKFSFNDNPCLFL